MRDTQRRANERGRIRNTSNRPARPVQPGRPAVYLYRDRRRRRARWRLLCAALLALVLILAVVLLLRGGRKAPAPEPEPTPTASATPSPAPTPTPTPAPAATPMTLTGPDVTEGQPSLEVATQEDLVAVLRWMIHDGASIVKLDSLALSDGEIEETVSQFSNYFEAYGVDAETVRLGVRFKPGLKALLALEAGIADQLEGDEREVADQANAVIDRLIGPDMTDVEKELAIHDYISAHCKYQSNGAGEDVGNAVGFFRDGRCSCAGYVDTFRLLAKLAGLEVETIGGPTTRDMPGEKGHAWNLVRLDGLWYAVDLTWDDMLGSSAAEHMFFNLPYTSFSGYRKTDKSICPPGDYAVLVDDKYYFNTPEYTARTLEEALALATRQLDAGGPAYVYFTDGDYSDALSAALVQRYGGKLMATELSEETTLSVYRYAL